MTIRPELTMLAVLTAATMALGAAACADETGAEPPPIHAPRRAPPEEIVLVPEVGESLAAAPIEGDGGAPAPDPGDLEEPAPEPPPPPPEPPAPPPPPTPLELTITSAAGGHSILSPSSAVCSDIGADSSFTLTNARPVPVEVVWINYQCNEVSYGVVQPGSTVHHPTYTGHRWRLRSTDGVPPRDFTLHTPGMQYAVTAR